MVRRAAVVPWKARVAPPGATAALTRFTFSLCTNKMTHVVTEACINCKYTDCVDVCPVDCFKEGPNFLTIDPDECIDCAVCIPECPANAIFAEEDVPKDQMHMVEINAQLATDPSYKTITKRKDALPEADDWRDRTDKLQFLDR